MQSASLQWQVAANTHTGNIRKINEDSLMAKDELQLWAVADGMGGHEAGDIASQMIVRYLENIEDRESLSDFVNLLEDTLLDVNADILDLAEEKYNGKTMGATIVLMTARGSVGICMWAGDSRLYRLRQGELVQISRDHSQVEEMIECGLLKREEAENHPSSNVITRAVGAGNKLFIDVTAFDLESNDTYLLCSDGLYNEVEDLDITTCLLMKSVNQSATALIDHALANGARDNVSVVVSRAS